VRERIEYRFIVPSAAVFTLYSYSKTLEYRLEYTTAGSLNNLPSETTQHDELGVGAMHCVCTRQWNLKDACLETGAADAAQHDELEATTIIWSITYPMLTMPPMRFFFIKNRRGGNVGCTNKS
jgi:hypothetical protein